MTGKTADPLITMVDYGGSNLRSVQKAFEAVGVRVVTTADADIVRAAARLVLPGVGAFKAGIDGLRAGGLDTAIIDAVSGGVPLLGICLGMQLLFDESEEMGRHAGLSLLPGKVLRFHGRPPTEADRGLKVPHMGWNQIQHDDEHPLLAGIATGAYAYFVHSYYCAPAQPAHILATAEYGVQFAAIAGSGRTVGIQFHPEKSQSIGLRILRNFAEWEVGLDGI
jgi:glutamine amidotransferase